MHRMERGATRLHGPLVSGAYGASISENSKPGEMVPTMDSDASDLEGSTEPTHFGSVNRRAAL